MQEIAISVHTPPRVSPVQLVAPDSVESKFRALEGSDVDDELSKMKAQLGSGTVKGEVGRARRVPPACIPPSRCALEASILATNFLKILHSWLRSWPARQGAQLIRPAHPCAASPVAAAARPAAGGCPGLRAAGHEEAHERRAVMQRIPAPSGAWRPPDLAFGSFGPTLHPPLAPIPSL